MDQQQKLGRRERLFRDAPRLAGALLVLLLSLHSSSAGACPAKNLSHSASAASASCVGGGIDGVVTVGASAASVALAAEPPEADCEASHQTEVPSDRRALPLNVVGSTPAASVSDQT